MPDSQPQPRVRATHYVLASITAALIEAAPALGLSDLTVDNLENCLEALPVPIGAVCEETTPWAS